MPIVTADGADLTLFHVAADAYGDATRAIRIAQSSRLLDPWLSALVVLDVPRDPGRNTGGLPEQG